MRNEFATTLIGAAASCALAMGAMAPCALGQCPTQWATMGYDANGALVHPTGGTMEMAEWDPDGDGPLTPRVAVVVSNINLEGRWRQGVVDIDPMTGRWEARFPNAAATHVARVDSGSDQLVVAGSHFAAPGNVQYRGAAHWDQGAWQVINTDASTFLATTSLISHRDGVAGLVYEFSDLLGKVLEWSPETGWSVLQSGIWGRVNALLSVGSDELVLGGSFYTVGGTTALNIARWNGTSWQAMGQGLGVVHCLAQGPDSTIYAGLNLNQTFPDGRSSNVAKWNGQAWEAVGSTLTGSVGKILALRDGRLLAIARTDPFRLAGSSARPAVAQLVDGEWAGIDGLTASRVLAGVELDDGSLMLSGWFDVEGVSRLGLVRERPQGWCALCPPCIADFDQDGGVTAADVGAFLTDFEQGSPCADVDQNGGVDGGDLGAFFAVFEAGGC